MTQGLLSPGVIGVLSALLEARTGQVIDPSRTWRIASALKPVMADAGVADAQALVAALGEAGAGPLADRVVDALLNQESSFFRDGLVLETVATAIEAADQVNPLRRVRVWSAGCSGGQEIYSLAMTLLDRGGFRFANLPEMLATDVSAATVERARRGVFSQFEIQRGLPVRTMMRWFEQQEDGWALRRELARTVTFRRQNVVDGPMPPGLFDIVLCRNVLLYFPHAVRRRVLDRLARSLRPDGLLVLGAGETVLGLSDAFVACQRFRGLYRRREVAMPARAVG